MHPASAPYVIYVEDDRINIVLMEEVFRRLPGWRLHCAEDGAQALALLSEGRPDLVLIDMNLPDMTGLDLLQKLRGEAATAELRCVALSADDLREQVEFALQAGFSDYWLKPIDVERLAESLKTTLSFESLELKSLG